MTVHADPQAPQRLSRDAYLLLERKLQGLRLRVMRLAAKLAREKDAPTITVSHVQEALARFAELGLDLNVGSAPSVGRFPDEPYQFLAQRLITLHTVLTAGAADCAENRTTDKVQSYSADEHSMLIGTEDVESAWNEIGRENRLFSVFFP